MPISKVFTSDLPDLVRESKLDAQTLRGFTIHTFHDSSKIKEQGGPREEFWRRKERIGGGSFGQVWLEECVKGCRGPKLRAVKEITTTRHNIDYTRELEAIALFSHKKYERCFVKSFGWHEGADAIFITMEYLKHGDLHYYLHQASPLLEREACEITSQILHGLSFMHENGFAHRDLKPGNILIKSKPPKSWRVKIGDFGISKRTSDGLGLSTLKGTVGFIAPELYGFTGRRGSIPSTQNPSAADMWSLGEITFQMLTKTPTFKDLDSLSGFARGRRSFPSNILETRKVSDYGQNFIISVMKPSPNDRLTAEQALAHDWIKQLKLTEKKPTPLPTLESVMSRETRAPVRTETFPEPSARWSVISKLSFISDQSSNSPMQAQMPDGVDMSQTHQFLPLPTFGSDISSTQQERAKTSGDETARNVATKVSETLNATNNPGKAASSLPPPTTNSIHPKKAPHATSRRAGAQPTKRINVDRKLSERVKSRLGTLKEAFDTSLDEEATLVPRGKHAGRRFELVESRNLFPIDEYDDQVKKLTWRNPIFMPGFKTIVSLHYWPAQVIVWNISTTVPVSGFKMTERSDEVQCIGLSADGKLLASGHELNDSWINLWEFSTGMVLQRFSCSSKIWSIIFSPDGQVLASAHKNNSCPDWSVYLWEVRTGKELQKIQGQDELLALRFSPDGKAIATKGKQDVSLWDPKTGAPLRKVVNKYWGEGFTFSSDGSVIARSNGNILLANPTTLKSVRELKLPADFHGTKAFIREFMAFSDDGKMLAISRAYISAPTPVRDVVMIWDLTQPDDFPNIVIRGSKLYDVQTIGFQPNSHVLMTADRLRRVRYWDADQLHNAED